MAEMVAEHRLAGGAHRKALLQRVAAAGGDPGDLGRKAVDQLALLLQQALGDEHGHGHVLMAGGLEAGVQIFLDVFPDGVAIGAQHNKALTLEYSTSSAFVQMSVYHWAKSTS